MNKQNKISIWVVITAIVCITALECVALIMGVNGTIFAIVIAIIAGLAGYIIPPSIKFK